MFPYRLLYAAFIALYLPFTSCFVMTAGEGKYRRDLKRHPAEAARVCDSIRGMLAGRDTGDVWMDMEDLVKGDTVLLAGWQRYGTDVRWNAKDSLLTLEFNSVLWNDGLRYDFSAKGNHLQRQFRKHYRLRRVNRRLYYQRAYRPVMTMVSRIGF